jgi:hypothetical protein
MPKSLSVSSADLSSLSALFDKLPPDKATALNPSDPVHRAGIQAALAAANRSPKRYPALHAGVANGARPKAGDTLTLIDRGRDNTGRATAMTWYAAGPKALYAGGSLFALDGESGKLLAAGHNSNVGEGFVQLSTDTKSAKPAGKSLKLLSVNHSVSKTGDVSFTALASSASLAAAGDATIAVFQPTQTPKKPSLGVQIAVGRNSVSIDADYIYTEPQNITNPYLIIPFVGQASLPYVVKGTLGQPLTGAKLTTKIYFVASGVTTAIPMSTQYTKNFNTAITINAGNSMMIEWSYPYDGQSYTNTLSLIYNPYSLVNETTSYFFFSFEIPVLGAPTPTYTFAVCSTGTPNKPTYQCVPVPNIYFWWHCLAAGTKVRLADGTEAAIESIHNKHRVKTGGRKGAQLAVEATSRGPHKASASDSAERAVYRLVTDAGHELVGTGQHVVSTPEGLVPLHALRASDKVATENGTARVASCEKIDFDGACYNLKLGDANDRSAGLADDAVCTYIANGIVVGDHLAQRGEQRRLARDMKHMRTRLPKHLVVDYSSAVTDIRY